MGSTSRIRSLCQGVNWAIYSRRQQDGPVGKTEAAQESMFSSKPIQRMVGLAVLVLLVIVIACGPAAPEYAAPSQQPALSPVTSPPPPSAVELEVKAGTTEVTARWGPVSTASSYRVLWRLHGNEFDDDNETTVTGTTATFDVEEQGLWVVRVESCDGMDCGRGSTNSTPVVINIPGHEALRVWFEHVSDADDENAISAVNLDWDPLPGYYVVKYRLSNHEEWAVSEPLSEVGYTLNAASFERFDLGGKPIIRVYFNCDEDGGRCTHLGQQPNTLIQHVEDDAEPLAPTPSGARSTNQSSGLERDPVTHKLRPISDYTVTNETRDGVSYRCVSRQAENDWEGAKFGSSGEAIKACVGARVINEYVFDPDAIFPDEEPCGERKPKTDIERRVFGDTVTVCNEHPEIGSGTDHPGKDGQSSGEGSGPRSHDQNHLVDATPFLSWHATYALPEGSSSICTNREQRYFNSHGNWDFETWITGGWCYDWRYKVTQVHTLTASTGSDGPGLFWNVVEFITGVEHITRCGWVSGYSADNPYEKIWKYLNPGDTDQDISPHVLDWGYSAIVKAKYGNPAGNLGGTDVGYGIPVTFDACEYAAFYGQAGILLDWEGQDGPWPQ